jgi:hypothetical protein
MKVNIDYSQLTWKQMSNIVLAIHKEMKRRNPIGINCYAGYVETAAAALLEISGGEADNFSSESGPKEPKWRKSRKSE